MQALDSGEGMVMAEISQFRGALLAAACGDALGYPLEGLDAARIRRRFGPFGLRTLVRTKASRFLAPVSANTQTLLAAADGLFWADAKALASAEGIYRGYMRWFYSQTGEAPRRGQRTWMRRQPHERTFCLVREKFMHARRGMGETSLAALGSVEPGSLKNKVNDSKDSEPLVRSGPIGLVYAGRPKEAFYEGVRSAVYTHSRPEAYLSAASVAFLVASLAGGISLPKSIAALLSLLSGMDHTETITELLETAVQAANEEPAGTPEAWSQLGTLRLLGRGETAPDALAIAVYCVLVCDDPFEAVILAANHDGKSSVTAALAGLIEGVRFGDRFLPASWLAGLESQALIGQVGEALYETFKKNTPG